MDVVRAIEIWIEHDPLEQERHEGDVVLGGKPRKNSVIFQRVVEAIERRRLHAAQQHADTVRLRSLDGRCEILFNCVDIDASKTVIGAELEDQDRAVGGQCGVETPQSIGRRVAAHALITNRPTWMRGVEPFLQDCRECAAAGRRHRETIAEHDDAAWRRRRRDWSRG
jgi:hypothetical protein